MTSEPRKPNVLFVDDELDVLLGIQVSLRKSPIQTFITTQPREVPFFLSSQSIDVLVCDESMPNVSGSALLDSLRRSFPGTARILLTGRCDLPMAVRAIKQGRLFRYLTKPVTGPNLLNAILQAVAHRALGDLPVHVRRERARFRLMRDLEQAYPGITRELRIDSSRSVNPADALLDPLDDPFRFD